LTFGKLLRNEGKFSDRVTLIMGAVVKLCSHFSETSDCLLYIYHFRGNADIPIQRGILQQSSALCVLNWILRQIAREGKIHRFS